MENEVERVLPDNEGTGVTGDQPKAFSAAAAEDVCPTADCGVCEAGHVHAEGSEAPNPEELSEEQKQFAEEFKRNPEAALRKLRGKHFTVRHIPLPCGHKMDLINEPRHRNCEQCYWYWFNHHGPLVQAVIDAHQTEGKEFVIRMRGKHFFRQFTRFMATVNAMIAEGKANAVLGNEISGQAEVESVPTEKSEQTSEEPAVVLSQE